MAKRWYYKDENGNKVPVPQYKIDADNYYTKEMSDSRYYEKSATDTMLGDKVSKSDIVQSTGTSTTAVMSQKAVTDAIAVEETRAREAEENLAGKVTELDFRTEGISNEVIETEDDSISIEDNNGNEVFHLDENGLDAKNVNSNGKPVLTEHQDISSIIEGLSAVENKTISITEERTQDITEEIIIGESETDPTAIFTSRGVKVKAITDLDGNPISGALSNIDKKVADFEPFFYSVAKGRLNDSNGVGTGWFDRPCILHISDTHQYNTLIGESIGLSLNKCRVICNTGDDANAMSSTSSATTIGELNNTKDTVLSSNSSLPYLCTKGNHDVPNITRAQYRNIMGQLVSNYATVTFGSSDGMYYYYDILFDSTSGTFRFIVLDPFDYPDGDFSSTRQFQSCTFSQEQIDWLITVLQDAAEKGYKVITMMHYSFGDNDLNFNEEKAKPDALFYQDAFMVPDIIDAIQNGTVLNKTYPDSKGSQTITVNISSSSYKLHYICHLFGHIHSKNYYRCQKTDGSKLYNILMLGEAALGIYGNALNKAFRYSGTVNDIACSILAVDSVEKYIYRVAYGSFMHYDCSKSDRITKIKYNFND